MSLNKFQQHFFVIADCDGIVVVGSMVATRQAAAWCCSRWCDNSANLKQLPERQRERAQDGEGTARASGLFHHKLLNDTTGHEGSRSGVVGGWGCGGHVGVWLTEWLTKPPHNHASSSHIPSPISHLPVPSPGRLVGHSVMPHNIDLQLRHPWPPATPWPQRVWWSFPEALVLSPVSLSLSLPSCWVRLQRDCRRGAVGGWWFVV